MAVGPGGTFVGIGPGFSANAQAVVLARESGDARLVAFGFSSIGDCVYDGVRDVLYVSDNADGADLPGALSGDTVFAVPNASTASGLTASGLELVPAGTVPFAAGLAVDTAGDVFLSDAAGGGAGIILVWFAYYWHQPHPMNLWSYAPLYALLLAPYLDRRKLERFGHGSLRAIFDLRFALVFFVVLPQIAEINVQGFEESLAAIRDKPETTREISGVRLDPELASVLEDKASYLRQLSTKSSVAYVSHLSFMMAKLSDHPNPLPVQDVFAETLSNVGFDDLVETLISTSPDLILFDDPEAEDVTVSKRSEWPARLWRHRMSFGRRLKRALQAYYRPQGTASGWEVWERLPSPEATRSNRSGYSSGYRRSANPRRGTHGRAQLLSVTAQDSVDYSS